MSRAVRRSRYRAIVQSQTPRLPANNDDDESNDGGDPNLDEVRTFLL